MHDYVICSFLNIRHRKWTLGAPDFGAAAGGVHSRWAPRYTWCCCSSSSILPWSWWLGIVEVTNANQWNTLYFPNLILSMYLYRSYFKLIFVGVKEHVIKHYQLMLANFKIPVYFINNLILKYNDSEQILCECFKGLIIF